MKCVNDKYRMHYKNIDRERNHFDKRDYSWIVVSVLFLVPMFLLVLVGMAISISNKNSIENNKDTLIEINRNSFGCIQYRYNSDILWRCPKNSGITEIESQKCTSGKHSTCSTIKEPVI